MYNLPIVSFCKVESTISNSIYALDETTTNY